MATRIEFFGPVAIRMEFFGPVDMYARKEDNIWVAWADPFSEFGEGETKEKAIAALRNAVAGYLELVATEVRRADGKPIRFCHPLSDEEKKGAEKSTCMLVAFLCETGDNDSPGLPGDRLHPVTMLLDSMRAGAQIVVGPTWALRGEDMEGGERWRLNSDCPTAGTGRRRGSDTRKSCR
jgi:predicted RNase H-like HicB family nuclease